MDKEFEQWLGGRRERRRESIIDAKLPDRPLGAPWQEQELSSQETRDLLYQQLGVSMEDLVQQERDLVQQNQRQIWPQQGAEDYVMQGDAGSHDQRREETSELGGAFFVPTAEGGYYQDVQGQEDPAYAQQMEQQMKEFEQQIRLGQHQYPRPEELRADGEDEWPPDLVLEDRQAQPQDPQQQQQPQQQEEQYPQPQLGDGAVNLQYPQWGFQPDPYVDLLRQREQERFTRLQAMAERIDEQAVADAAEEVFKAPKVRDKRLKGYKERQCMEGIGGMHIRTPGELHTKEVA